MAYYIIADNQELTSYALEKLIDKGERDTVVRATSRSELLERLKGHGQAVVLLDYTLFDFADADTLLILSERYTRARWILISEELTTDFLHRMVYASTTFSIVFKDSPLKQVADALEYARQGRRYVCQRAMEIILSEQHREEDQEAATLTNTEIEIVKGIAQGKTTKEIAAERFSSIHTINTHRKNIFRKLGVNTAHEAVKYAFRAGWVDPSEFYI